MYRYAYPEEYSTFGITTRKTDTCLFVYRRLNLVPQYSRETEVRTFKDAYEVIMSTIDPVQLVFSAKMIASTKLTDRGYYEVRYRDISNWENVIRNI